MSAGRRRDPPASPPPFPRFTLNVLGRGDTDSLVAEGRIQGKPCRVTIDTGASVTIARPDIVAGQPERRPSRAYVLQTASGETIPVIKQSQVELTLGRRPIRIWVFVAEITDEFILGLDVLRAYDAFVDLGRHLLRLGQEEVTLWEPDAQPKSIRITLASEEVIPARCERVVMARLEAPLRAVNVLVEPNLETSGGVYIARTLVRAQVRVPVRMMNVTDRDKVLSEGTTIGCGEPVMWAGAPDDSEVRTGQPQELCKQLQDVVKGAKPNLNNREIEVLTDFISEYQDVFTTRNGDYGRTDRVYHRIDTGDARPIRQPPRRLPLAKQNEVNGLVDDMKGRGVIEDSDSPWSSPVVLVRKKDGSLRFCVDYRRLNDVTRKDCFPLPRIDDTLDTLAGAKWFSTLDLKSGYWQVALHPEDKEKTAFSTGQGLWQFTVMPFGLCNAPATFERLMESVLRGLTYDACLVYLDDVIVVGRNFQEQLDNLRKVFQRIREARLKLNPGKCQLFQKEVRYLGHVVSASGIATDPEKLEAVKSWPPPTDKHQLRSFLGLCTYYRRFILGFADIAKPLTRLTEEKRKFEWSPEAEVAFASLKEALCAAPVRGYPQQGKQFIVDTDASNAGIGGVLSQVQEGNERVVAYFSKTLSKAERNYCVTRRELLAMVRTLEHFHKYLYGQQFHLRTDHSALTWLLNFKNLEGQTARWVQRLQEYHFTSEHRQGVKHTNADALSRRPCTEECTHCRKVEHRAEIPKVRVVATTPSEGWDNRALRKEQLEDEDVGQLLREVEAGQRPEWGEISDRSSVYKSYWAQWKSLAVRDGILIRYWESTDGRKKTVQIIVPRSKVKEVLEEMHGGSSGGHLGANKTLDKVRQRYYWLNLRADVERWCQQCDTCTASRGPRTRSRGLMQQYNVGAPFERIAIDVAGPFPMSERGNRYLLVAMDYFTKWPEVYAIPNQEAATVADALVTNLFCRFGVPRQLHSDQGRNFESRLMQEVLERLGISKTRTTPLHPQSDGMVERYIKTIEEHLRKVVSAHQRDWDERLPIFLLSYRASTHETTGLTPANMLFGRELRLPCDLLFGAPPDKAEPINEYAANLVEKLHDTHRFGRQHMKVASDRMKARYDQLANSAGFQEGDRVWLYRPTRTKGKSPKLQRSWEGPYNIITRINDVIYRIQRHGRAKRIVVHLDRLAPYLGPTRDE